MSAIRFAYLGVTHPHAQGYLESLRLMPDVEVVGLHDTEPGGREAVPAHLAECPYYDDLGTLLDRARPDAAMISLPADVCPNAVIQCAEAGVHCFAEKPVARTATELDPVDAAVKRQGVRFHLGFTRRFGPHGNTMRDLVQQGILGDIDMVEMRLITTSVRIRDPRHYFFHRRRSGGGILHWLACHWLDLMRYVTGLEVAEVSAILDTRSGEPIDVEDTAVVAMRLSNGALASLQAAYSSAANSSGAGRPSDSFFAVRGSLGWARWDTDRAEISVRSEHPSWKVAPERTIGFTLPIVGGYGGSAGRDSIRSFISSFREGSPSMFTVADARRVLEMIDAAHSSSESGRRVAVK